MLPWWVTGKGATCQYRRGSVIPGSGKFPGEGNGIPLQYSCLQNPMDRGSWWATGHAVAETQKRLSSVQSSRSVVSDSPTLWTAARQASLSITNSWSLLKLMSIELVMPYKHLILCGHLLLPPSIFPSIRVFSNQWVLRIRWPEYWTFSLNNSPSNEYSGLISFRIDGLEFSHPYMTPGKTIALTRQDFVGEVMSLLF